MRREILLTSQEVAEGGGLRQRFAVSLDRRAILVVLRFGRLSLPEHSSDLFSVLGNCDLFRNMSSSRRAHNDRPSQSHWHLGLFHILGLEGVPKAIDALLDRCHRCVLPRAILLRKVLWRLLLLLSEHRIVSQPVLST